MSPILYIPWFKLNPIDIPGPVDLQPFGILVAIGILFGSKVATWRGERIGVPSEVVSNFLFFVILNGLIAAMVLNMAFYEPHKLVGYLHGEISYPGLSSFGGFFGGTVAAIYFRNKHRMSLMVLGDIFCFAFPFAWLICRSGCFVVHDHPGIPTDFFLAVDNYNYGGVPRHDLGLYEVLWSAVMMGILLMLQRTPRPTGFFMALVPLCYAPIRFALDFLREDAAGGGDVRYGALTPGHYWAIAMLIAGIAVAVRVKRGPAMQLYLDGAPTGAEDREHEATDGQDPGQGSSGKTTVRKAKKKKKR